MTENRPPSIKKRRDLTNGPGKLTQALGINDARFHGTDLTTRPLFFAEDDQSLAPRTIETSSRIGLTRGVDRPYRFFVAGHPFVSPGEPSDRRVARKTKKGSR